METKQDDRTVEQKFIGELEQNEKKLEQMDNMNKTKDLSKIMGDE